MKLGSELSSTDQKYVLRAFTHRYTGDHKPNWTNSPWKFGEYPLHFKDDKDWLENTKFFVTKNGSLDNRYNRCESTPTWPNNPELRK